MWRSREEKDYSCGADTLDFFFNCIGYFNHYSYFTNKLWKKVKGFEKEDEAEVKCVFMSWWCKHTTGIITYPVGMAWSTIHGSEDGFDNYIEKWMPLIEDFDNWCNMQR